MAANGKLIDLPLGWLLLSLRHEEWRATMGIIQLLWCAAIGTAVADDVESQQRWTFRAAGTGRDLVEFRAIPAMGFFPTGGSAEVNETQLSTYVSGASLDLLNFYFPENKLSLMNASVYLLGLDWTKIGDQDEAYVAKLAYLRFGPHFLAPPLTLKLPSGAEKAVGSLGFQVGYGLLLQSKLDELSTSTASGFDVSFTFSLGDYHPVTTSPDEPTPELELAEEVVRVRWTPPRGTADVRYYWVVAKEGVDFIGLDGCPEDAPVRRQVPASQHYEVLTELESGRDYRINVCAEFDDGRTSAGNGLVLSEHQWGTGTLGPGDPPPDPPPPSPGAKKTRFRYGLALGSPSEIRAGVEIRESFLRRIELSAGVSPLVINEWGGFYDQAGHPVDGRTWSLTEVYGFFPVKLGVSVAPRKEGPFEVGLYAGPGFTTAFISRPVFMTEGVKLSLHKPGGSFFGDLGIGFAHTNGTVDYSNGSTGYYSIGIVPTLSLGWMFPAT